MTEIENVDLSKVNSLVDDMPDSLKKRTLLFVNEELSSIQIKVKQFKKEGKTEALNALLYEVMFLQSLTDKALKLKT